MPFSFSQDQDEHPLIQLTPRYPFAFASADGSNLYTTDGRTCLDFTGGMGAAPLGQAHPSWCEAVMDQSLWLGVAPPQFQTQPAERLAERLCHETGLAAACFLSSGMEANRLMCHAARAYGRERHGVERNLILSLQEGGSFMPEGVLPIEANMESVRAQATHRVCAVMLSLLPNGFLPLPQAFVHALAVLCAEQDWLLLIDETRTGNGRCGSLFAFLQYGILPDIISFSSAISGGLPLGGILVNKRCRGYVGQEAALEFSIGASPISCAAALSLLDTLNEQTLAQAREKGDYLRQGIEALQLPSLGSTNGMGLMISLHLPRGQQAFHLADRLAEHGLLTIPGHKALGLMPPVTVTQAELDRAIAILQEVLEKGA